MGYGIKLTVVGPYSDLIRPELFSHYHVRENSNEKDTVLIECAELEFNTAREMFMHYTEFSYKDFHKAISAEIMRKKIPCLEVYNFERGFEELNIQDIQTFCDLGFTFFLTLV